MLWIIIDLFAQTILIYLIAYETFKSVNYRIEIVVSPGIYSKILQHLFQLIHIAIRIGPKKENQKGGRF